MFQEEKIGEKKDADRDWDDDGFHPPVCRGAVAQGLAPRGNFAKRLGHRRRSIAVVGARRDRFVEIFTACRF
jgi:hypothetical protein